MIATDRNVVLHGTWREQAPLAPLTSWRIGGPAERMYLATDAADLASAIASLDADEPLFWLGLGSNLLVRDGGIRGTVISTRQALTALADEGQGRIWVGAGVACARVAKFCTSRDRVGAEFLVGIPGTVGGALAMNAGAWGDETWDYVEAVQTVDRQGELRERLPADYRIGYRQVEGPADEWFTGARFCFETGDGAAAAARVRELLTRRAETQPTSAKSCGSVFRNPPGDHAARLIEACGLKGVREGDAEVSEKHANFIINRGQATAAHVERLIERIRETVRAQTGVELRTEVLIVGEHA